MPTTTTTLDDLVDALGDLRRFWERPDRKRRFLTELGAPVELAVLRVLRAVEQLIASGSPEPGVSDVADALAVDTSTASRLVEQAVQAGLLSREPGQEDRRRSGLELSEPGSALLARASRIRRRWLAEITAQWRPEDVATLAALLRRFLDDATANESRHR